VNDQPSRSARLRYTATGALAALAAVGALAGTAALAARSPAKAHGHAAAANAPKGLGPTSPAPGKTEAPQPPVNHQPFLDAVQQLLDTGTITAAQAQIVDGEIQAGTVDTATLTGFTAAQLKAVQGALANAKRTLAGSHSCASK
jgi:hypothetical protein